MGLFEVVWKARYDYVHEHGVQPDYIVLTPEQADELRPHIPASVFDGKPVGAPGILIAAPGAPVAQKDSIIDLRGVVDSTP